MSAKLFATLCLFCFLCVAACSQQTTEPPKPVRVSACEDKLDGVRRISPDFGLSFDVPESRFKITQQRRDMPVMTVYLVTLRDDISTRILVSMGDEDFPNLKTIYPTFSDTVGRRDVRGANGKFLGTDRWGYLKTGERWRFVQFSTRDSVGYEPVPPAKADRLDELIGTACFSQSEKPK